MAERYHDTQDGSLEAHPYGESVLIVEDTDFMAKALVDIYVSGGYETYLAKNGLEALEIYERLMPDLVTLDIVMPGMDGLEVLEQLMNTDPGCRVLMASAMGLESQVLEAMKLGARNHILKPFERNKVLMMTRKVLNEY